MTDVFIYCSRRDIEIAQELTEAMGAVVSCSRPVVDAKWVNFFTLAS
ncbi:MAG: FAD-binding protein [Desulfobacteraceae bacterium]|jgi:electron transfer flavoprotein alpha subunit